MPYCREKSVHTYILFYLSTNALRSPLRSLTRRRGGSGRRAPHPPPQVQRQRGSWAGACNPRTSITHGHLGCAPGQQLCDSATPLALPFIHKRPCGPKLTSQRLLAFLGRASGAFTEGTLWASIRAQLGPMQEHPPRSSCTVTVRLGLEECKWVPGGRPGCESSKLSYKS